MANTVVLFGEAGSNSIYQIGKVGYDSGPSGALYTDPDDTPFTGTLKTERISPAGEDALVRFRRVALRAYKVGTWAATFTVWVDDVQTKIWDNDGDSVTFGEQLDQVVTITSESDDTGEGEAVIEVDIDATGTFIQVQVELQSDEIQGYFLPESIEVHLQAIREAKSRDTAESQ